MVCIGPGLQCGNWYNYARVMIEHAANIYMRQILNNRLFNMLFIFIDIDRFNRSHKLRKIKKEAYASFFT